MSADELKLIRRVTDLTIALEESIVHIERRVLTSDDVDILVALRIVHRRSGKDA